MANRKIAYTLGRGWAYISDMSSTSGYMGAKYVQELGPRIFDMFSASGYMGAKYVQEFGPIFFDMSSTSGNMGATYFQEFGPRFLACHVPNLACHGVSISCVSMSSVSCRVIILRVSVSVPCRGHPDRLGGRILFFCLPLSSQPRLNLLSTQQQGPHPAHAPVVVC